MPKYDKGFRKLIAWQQAHQLVGQIYDVTEHFPRHEMYGVISQVRRAISSVAAQIAEGSRMPTANHRKLYYDRAYASAAEVDYFLELSLERQYFDQGKYDELMNKLNYVSALVLGLSKSCI
jgi:four helix bundle protein